MNKIIISSARKVLRDTLDISLKETEDMPIYLIIKLLELSNKKLEIENEINCLIHDYKEGENLEENQNV